MPGQYDHRCTQTQCRGAGAEPSQEIQCRRDLAETGKMVFDNEGAMKTQGLGFDVVFDEVAKAFGTIEFAAAATRRRAAEQTEPHGRFPRLLSIPGYALGRAMPIAGSARTP